MTHGPNDPSPQQEPTHDVPVYPEQDPPPGTETGLSVCFAAAGPGERERHREGQGNELPDEGPEDVDEDDLDPQVPHSPPDGKQGRVLFDENWVAD